MRDLRDQTDRFPLLAASVYGALGLVVIGVGAVALAAEMANRWEYYFLMEEVVATATPPVVGLLVAAFLVGAGAVARS